MLSENSYVNLGDLGLNASNWFSGFNKSFPDIKHALDYGSGAALMTDFPVDSFDESMLEEKFVEISSKFGQLNVRGNTSSPVWRVSPPKGNLDRPLSYSEQKNIAPLHTDNSYSDKPDRYLIFLVVNPANDGGENIVLSNHYLIDEFKKVDDAEETIDILRSELFPFSMSHAFHTKSMGEERPIMIAPVFGDDVEVRFQIKALMEGFKRRPDLATPEKVKAVEHFNQFLQAHLSLPGERLQRGDIMIINNHRAFHSRSAFTDVNRLLFRISVKASDIVKSHDLLLESEVSSLN